MKHVVIAFCLVFVCLFSSAQSISQDNPVPTFKFGEDSLMRHLQYNTGYSWLGRDIGAQGTVYMGFTVDTLGNVKDIVVKKGLEVGIEYNCIQSIKQTSGEWIPASQGGKCVEGEVIVPIKFQMKTKTHKGFVPSTAPTYTPHDRAMAEFNHGRISMGNENYERAKMYFDAVLKYDGEFVEARFNRAICYYNLGQIDKGCAEMRFCADQGLEIARTTLEEECGGE